MWISKKIKAPIIPKHNKPNPISIIRDRPIRITIPTTSHTTRLTIANLKYATRKKAAMRNIESNEINRMYLNNPLLFVCNDLKFNSFIFFLHSFKR